MQHLTMKANDNNNDNKMEKVAKKKDYYWMAKLNSCNISFMIHANL